MKIYPDKQSRQEYLETQIARSDSKFEYCKVSINDPVNYREVVKNDLAQNGRREIEGPVLCLGTRNGREVDLFRAAFFGSKIQVGFLKLMESQGRGFKSGLRVIHSRGRSKIEKLDSRAVIGVEINPRAARSDIWIGSFDEMPADWDGQFKIVYSNSFDQSQDPEKTAAEWNRVTAPGGYLIFAFNEEDEPSVHDPVGRITLDDVKRLFTGELIYYRRRGSRNGYSEAIVRRTGP